MTDTERPKNVIAESGSAIRLLDATIIEGAEIIATPNGITARWVWNECGDTRELAAPWDAVLAKIPPDALIAARPGVWRDTVGRGETFTIGKTGEDGESDGTGEGPATILTICHDAGEAV